MHPLEIFRSVEWIWAIWLVLTPVLIGRTLKLLKSIRAKGWKKLLQGEEGSAYTLAFVMTFPLYAMMIALVIECTIILVVKLGTVYASYAAARSVIVWESAKDQQGNRYTSAKTREKAKKAAVLAMTPFATGMNENLLRPGILNTPVDSTFAYYAAAYWWHSEQGEANYQYMAKKYVYASFSTKIVSITPDPGRKATPDADLEVEIEYEYPFQIPGIGAILGESPFPLAPYKVLKIRTATILQSESPRNPELDLGINYRSE